MKGPFSCLVLLWIMKSEILTGASHVAQTVKDLPAMQETRVRSLGWQDPLEKETAPLQCSCLEHPVDRGAWRATVHGMAQSQTRLSDWHFHFRGIYRQAASLRSASPQCVLRAGTQGNGHENVPFALRGLRLQQGSHHTSSPCPLTPASLWAPETAEAAPLTVPTAPRGIQNPLRRLTAWGPAWLLQSTQRPPARHRAHLNNGQTLTSGSTRVGAASALFPQGQGEARSFPPTYI